MQVSNLGIYIHNYFFALWLWDRTPVHILALDISTSGPGEPFMMDYFLRCQNCPIVQGSVTWNLVTAYLSMLPFLSLIAPVFQSHCSTWASINTSCGLILLCIAPVVCQPLCLLAISKSCWKVCWNITHSFMKSFQIPLGRNNCTKSQSVIPLHFKNSF